MAARCITLKSFAEGRDLRAKVDPSPYGLGSGIRVRLQEKKWFWWETLDSIIPVNGSRDNQVTIKELAEWGIETLYDRELERRMQDKELDTYFNGTRR